MQLERGGTYASGTCPSTGGKSGIDVRDPSPFEARPSAERLRVTAKRQSASAPVGNDRARDDRFVSGAAPQAQISGGSPAALTKN